MKKVLILGANGFIGRHLSEDLVTDNNLEITLFSRKTDNIQHLTHHNNVSIIRGDFSDALGLVSVIKNQDIVYHLISSSIPSTSWLNPELEIQKNIIPSIRLFEICCELEVKKIVFISSGGTVYGEQSGRVDESTSLKPFSPYGISKVAIENYLRYFKKKNNINYDIYRLSNPYGIGQEKRGFGVINTWIKLAMNGKEIAVYGDGSIKKDFIYISDAIHLIKGSVYQNLSKSNTFNVCSGITSSLNDVLDIIRKLSNGSIKVRYSQPLKSDNKIVEMDNSKILKLYPDFSFNSLELGVKKLWVKTLKNK